jgi:hypothetical protein
MKRCVKKKEREEKRIGNKSISVKKHKVTSSSTRGGLWHKKGRNPLQRHVKSTNDARRSIRNEFLNFLEPIPENFGYSLGGYSHRERSRAPDRKKSTKRRRVKAGNKRAS